MVRLATPVSPVSLCFSASGLQIRLQIGTLACAFLTLLCLFGQGGGYTQESADLLRGVSLTLRPDQRVKWPRMRLFRHVMGHLRAR
jgi:hypothetical protein